MAKLGEATITGKGQISLPAKGLRALVLDHCLAI